jgi:signal transduction histidine kinase
MRIPISKNGRWPAFVVGGAALFAFAAATELISPHTAQIISNHSMTVLPLTAGILSAFVARKHVGRERTAWSLLAVWGLLSASGNAIWEYYEFVIHHAVPFPSLADAGYLGGNLCAVAAIAMLAIVPQQAARWRTVLDAVLIAGSVFIASWTVLLDDLYSSPGHAFAKSIGLAYPVVDVIIVSLILFVWSRSTARTRGPLMLIGLGLIGWAFADSSFSFLTLRNTYHSGHPIDAGWIGGDAFIVLAASLALRSRSATDVRADVVSEGFRLRLPYVAVGTALVVGGVSQLVKRVDVTLPLLVVLLLVVVARQFLALLEGKQVTIDRLHSLDEMKNGILNAVSHELRTPLTYIKGTAYMLQDNNLPDEIKQDLVSDLVASSDRLEETLTGLLDLGRLARGVLEPARRPTEITGLLLGVAEEVRSPDHSIRVASDPLVANVDPTQVERIIENLYVNAVRHTPPGTDVTALVTRTPEGVVISVEDTGPGVPEAIRDEIFHPFVQSDHTVQYGRGTGIGLSIVAKFAELHGGRAWVEESPSGGAKFCVLLGDMVVAAA